MSTYYVHLPSKYNVSLPSSPLSLILLLEMDDFDQTAVGMMDAIKHSFKENKLSELWEKLIYLSADGASVNSGKDSGLIAQLQEEHEWVLFVWCFSHRLELALKDALQDFTKPVDESLMHLYYLYHKSSKKLRELKSLFKDIKKDFEMFGDGVKPVKSTGTRWIDHRIRAMGRVVDKFGLYTRHLKDFISREKNSKVRATVQGKLTKMLDAQFILRCAFLKDLLTPAKIFSLVTQNKDPNIIETVQSVGRTKKDYKKLLKKFEENQDLVFELPTLKAVIAEIEGNGEVDGEPLYQGQRIKYYTRAKRFIGDHCCFLVESIIKCYEDRYYFEDDIENANGTTNDHLIFHICKVLNSTAWPTLPNNDDNDEDILRIQLNSVSNVYDQFSAMKIFENIRKEDVLDGYVEMVRYCQRYFDFEKVDQFELWHKVLMLCEDRKEWYDASLVIEICLCTPCSNATLERFFSQLKLVKTDQSLNAILRIKLRQTPLATFNDEYADKIVSYWYNQKSRRMNQGKRKEYKKRKSSKQSRETFDINTFTQDIDDSSTDSDSDDDSCSSDEDNA